MKRQRKTCPHWGAGERLRALWCKPASPPSLPWHVHFSPVLEGEAFYSEKEETLWVLLPDRKEVKSKALHRTQSHLSHTIILIFWFDLNPKGDQLIPLLAEPREKDKLTPANRGCVYTSCWGLFLVTSRKWWCCLESVMNKLFKNHWNQVECAMLHNFDGNTIDRVVNISL